MHLRLLLAGFVGTLALAFVVFVGFGSDDPTDNRAKGFQEACEGSAFVAVLTEDPARVTTVCSCILGWHLKDIRDGRGVLPIALYTVDGPAAANGLPERTLATDRRARQSCTAGRSAG